MPAQTLWIPGQLPGLNEIIDAASKHGRSWGGKRWNMWTARKKIEEHKIGLCILRVKLKPVDRAFFRFDWCEPDRKRDPDNISAGGRKVILDALVRNGILHNDGWRDIAGWTDAFRMDKKEVGVTVVIEETAPDTVSGAERKGVGFTPST